MASSDEMFERGVQDAERDDLNTFYYQHYYHYRQGYDKARRRLRREAPSTGIGNQWRWMIPAAVVLLLALWGLSRLGSRAAPTTQPLADVAATMVGAAPSTSVASPTRVPRTPTTLPATPTTPAAVLQINSIAVITNLSGNPLRVRDSAGIKGKVVGRLPEGTEVTVLEGPKEADGYTWWRVKSGTLVLEGWVAEQGTDGVVWLKAK